jgi:hypothetical protein
LNRGIWRVSWPVSDLKSEERSKLERFTQGDDVMKLFLFAVTALLTLANVSTAARALSSNPIVMAKVPFDFTVGHDHFPSGTYTISRDPWGLVTMQSIDRRLNVAVTTIFAPDSITGDKLVFRKYGGHYFLGKVSTAAFSAQFPVSKLEKAVRYRDAETIDESQRPIATR